MALLIDRGGAAMLFGSCIARNGFQGVAMFIGNARYRLFAHASGERGVPGAQEQVQMMPN
jgi:hypothetical protein